MALISHLGTKGQRPSRKASWLPQWQSLHKPVSQDCLECNTFTLLSMQMDRGCFEMHMAYTHAFMPLLHAFGWSRA